MPANDKSTQDYFGHAIILSDTHMFFNGPNVQQTERHEAQKISQLANENEHLGGFLT